MNKLLVICGPTAAGKTKIAVKLAKKFNGELISADSRQVYRDMDIGTGKDLGVFNKEGVKIWGLDLVKPSQKFSVSHWVRFTKKTIEDIWQRKKLAIIVGGTGFYIKGFLEGFETLGIAPDWQLRKQLNNLTTRQLMDYLEKINPERWLKMNKSDRNNPRRLVRAIEISKNFKNSEFKIKSDALKLKIKNTLIIGLRTNYKVLYERIDKRVEKRVEQGIIKEIKSLLEKGYSWRDPGFNTLGYKEFKAFFEKKISLKLAIERWKYDEHHYARRQITWFKKQKNICWFDINRKGWQNKIEKEVSDWLS